MSDLAQVAAMAEANWKPANQYWKERAENAEHKIEKLERELAAEKALADDLYGQVVAWVVLHPEDADRDDDVAMNAYRKARGL